jgi:3D-(3,5/4)-trihydroxycyclohexane-1,2-dione acylhydrolase (decyclizing)
MSGAMNSQWASQETVRLTTGQAVIRFLTAQYTRRDGVEQRAIPGAFGIFGHGNLCGLGQALQQEGKELPFYQPKNEQSAVHSAIGFAKARRRLATLAVTASIGPGSTNLVTGAATATTNRLPVLLLPGDVFATRRQGPVLQQLEHPTEADASVNDCLRPVSRFFDRIVRPEQLLTALPQAMRVLFDPAETGAVTVAIDQDTQGEAYDWPTRFFERQVWDVDRRPATPEQIEQAVQLISRSKRPLIIAGGGVRYSGAEAELLRFVRRLGIPIAETSAAKGTISTDELLVGGVGVNGTRAANQLARDADLVICVGTRLSDFTTASHSLFENEDVEFLGLNVCSADAYKLGASPIVADAKDALEKLLEQTLSIGYATSDDYRSEVQQAKREWSQALDEDLQPHEGERMSQGQLFRGLNEQLRADDWVVAAAGSPPGDLLKMLDCESGVRTHIEFAFSCMGHELPAGLGIRLAEPEAGEVYVVIGDGTYLMAPSELVTAVQEQLKITVIVAVNHGYQSIHGLQSSRIGPSFGNEFRRRNGDGLAGEYLPVDFAANAESFGCAIKRVNSVEEVGPALERARQESGPVVIVAEVEPRRGLLDAGAWWDLGLPEVAEESVTRELVDEDRRRAAGQRFYG